MVSYSNSGSCSRLEINRSAAWSSGRHLLSRSRATSWRIAVPQTTSAFQSSAARSNVAHACMSYSSSESQNITQGARASRRPSFRGALHPPEFSERVRRRIRESLTATDSTYSAVPSVDASSTTMISMLRNVCRRIESSARPIRPTSLKPMRTTLTRGSSLIGHP